MVGKEKRVWMWLIAVPVVNMPKARTLSDMLK